MSFRKRGEIVGPGGTTQPSIPRAVPGRSLPPPISANPLLNARGPPPPSATANVGTSSFKPAVPGRGETVASRPGAPVANRQIPGVQRPDIPLQKSKPKEDEQQFLGTHPGVRPSILTSQPCISTGSSDIDKVLSHQGLPIGSSLLIEENGTTDFASTLIKVYMSQGIVQNRINPAQQNTYEIVVGLDQMWTKTLPGVYKGSSKDRKKLTVKENESKISVSNLIDQQQQQQLHLQKQKQLEKEQEEISLQQQRHKPNNDLKIAWRYGLNQKKNDKSDNGLTESQYPHYNNQFDITTTLIPSATPKELTCIPLPTSPTSTYDPVLKHIEQTISRQPPTVLIRIAVPLFLNPMVYTTPSLLTSSEIVKFVFGLRRILKMNQSRVSLLLSINLDLYPRSNPLVTIIESLVDGIIELCPFNPQLYELMEKVYKNQPAKIKHGHLNILKVPVLSDVGMMCVQNMEYSFKNGKKKFEVEEWSIPVEEEDTSSNFEIAISGGSDAHGHDDHGHDHGHDNNPMKVQKQITKDIEF